MQKILVGIGAIVVVSYLGWQLGSAFGGIAPDNLPEWLKGPSLIRG